MNLNHSANFLILMLISTFVACTNNDEETVDLKTQAALDKLETIQESWEERVEADRADYCYVTSRCSFTGTCYYTEIQVQNHTVIARAYKQIQRNLDAPDELVTSWSENSDELDSHDDSFASKASTYEELLVTCETKYVSNVDNSSDVTFHIDADEEGLLEACAYEMSNCFDDCTVGIRIHAFELGNSDCSTTY